MTESAVIRPVFGFSDGIFSLVARESVQRAVIYPIEVDR
jgi:hypothetical protein